MRHSNREVADYLGVAHETINRDLRGANVPPEAIPPWEPTPEVGTNAPRRPTPKPPEGDTDALLHRILDELRELRAEIAPELAQRTRVLKALQGEFGRENFTAQDTLEIAATIAGDSPYALAMIPLLGGSPVGGLRRLSRRLAKLAGKPAGGLVLVRVGDDRGSSLYVIQNAPLARLGRHD